MASGPWQSDKVAIFTELVETETLLFLMFGPQGVIQCANDTPQTHKSDSHTAQHTAVTTATSSAHLRNSLRPKARSAPAMRSRLVEAVSDKVGLPTFAFPDELLLC